jgi:hypothetical protein
MDIASFKQMMLVFDDVTFLDPVDDNAWRAKLFKDMESRDDIRFSAYRDFYEHINLLITENVIRTVDPVGLKNVVNDKDTVSAAVSDLLDAEWVNLSSSPKKFGLPYRPSRNGEPTWQSFLPKLPEGFLAKLDKDSSLSHHLLHAGDSLRSWDLSYAAGSAAAINVHLAASEALKLAPITDSPLHHQLLMLKIEKSPKSCCNG